VYALYKPSVYALPWICSIAEIRRTDDDKITQDYRVKKKQQRGAINNTWDILYLQQVGDTHSPTVDGGQSDVRRRPIMENFHQTVKLNTLCAWRLSNVYMRLQIYAVVTFRKVWSKSDFAQIRTDYTYTYVQGTPV
jgi:hypothetical protein